MASHKIHLSFAQLVEVNVFHRINVMCNDVTITLLGHHRGNGIIAMTTYDVIRASIIHIA